MPFVVGELVSIYVLLFFKSVSILFRRCRCYFIYLTHFRTEVIAGNGTQRLVDMSLFCFDISLRISLRFFSAARLRYCVFYFGIDRQKIEFDEQFRLFIQTMNVKVLVQQRKKNPHSPQFHAPNSVSLGIFYAVIRKSL